VNIVWIIVKLLGGFVLLIKGADFLVDGAGSLAKRYNVSELVIGLTIVAFGTSAPELIVNGIASFQDKNQIVLGNVIGSNIFNIFLILGIAGIIRPLQVQKSTVWREIPFSLFAVVLLGVLTVEGFLLSGRPSIVSRIDAAILLLFFAGFIIYAFKLSGSGVMDSVDIKPRGPLLTVVLIIGGLGGLAFGGRFVVNAAVDAATLLGISERIIAITIVSAGTSLPELFTSAVAAFRGRNEIAVGNVVGSNIFNLMLILGVSALIKPVAFDWSRFGIDLAVLTAATLLLFVTMFTGKRKILDRWEAFVFIACFGGYLTWLIVSA
jgi:cation:H+ antiporter